MIKEAIIKLSKKQDLAYAEAEAVMDEIMRVRQHLYRCLLILLH